MVERSIIQSASTLSVRFPTPEDLIIMMAIAHRPKDLEDIRTIMDKNPKLQLISKIVSDKNNNASQMNESEVILKKSIVANQNATVVL